MAMIRALVLLLALTACARPDAGCLSYGEARLTMPRTLGEGPLPEWVAGLDDRMTAACR
jgi:hypothetical protein